jgi:uncharacterized protein (DUF697 family)
MERLSRDLLGKTQSAIINNQEKQGKILAIARYSDYDQICFQPSAEKYGVWIPASALVEYKQLLTSVPSKKVEYKQLATSAPSKNLVTTPIEISQKVLASAQKKAEQDLNSLVNYADNLVKNINDKASSDILLINQTIEQTQKLIEQTTNEIAKAGSNTINFVNQYLADLTAILGNLVTEINQTIQNVWNESFRQVVGITMKKVENNFSNAKQCVDNLKQEYPNDDSFTLAQKLINRSTIFSVGSGLVIDISKLAEELTDLSIGLDLFKNATLLVELVYQIGIAYGFDDLTKITKGEVIGILALCLIIDLLQQLGLKALTSTGPIVSIPVKAIANVALFQLVGYASCQYFEIKLSQAENPLTSEKAYQQFTAQLQSYLNEILSEQEKLAEVIKDAIIIKKEVPALAQA